MKAGAETWLDKGRGTGVDSNPEEFALGPGKVGGATKTARKVVSVYSSDEQRRAIGVSEALMV